MLRTYLIIAFALLGLVLEGCTAMEKLDGSTEEELKLFRMNKKQIWNELQRCRNENRKLQNQVSRVTQESQRTTDLQQQIRELENENKRLTSEKTELEDKLLALQVKEREPERGLPGREQKKEVHKLKIKVLSGDGKISSAKQMAEKLTKMGYRVRSVDFAARSNFGQTTVYFAPAVQKHADSLATQLGGSTISKPLSWPSAFDLIVVTGKSP